MQSGSATRPSPASMDAVASHDAVLPRFIASPQFFFIALVLLFAAQVVVRLITSPIALLDESWQLVLAQKWSIGYAAHPPLYTWLQIIFFKVFGESIFTLALLKNALLFALYAFTYGSARLLTRRHDYAVFATLCLLLTPQVSWESQRDLTHSALLGTTTAATLFAFLWLVEKPALGRYALFGVSAGCAALSKYNAGLFLVAFALASLSVPRYRALLLRTESLVSFALCVIVAAPHYIWAIQHTSEAFADSRKLEATRFLSWWSAALQLPWLMLKAALPNLVPVIAAYLLARPANALRLRTDAARMLFRGTVLSLVILGSMMFAMKAGGLRGRWFLPLFICAPILLIAQLDRVPRWLFRLAAVVVLAGVSTVLVLLPWNANRGGGSRAQDLTAATLNDVSASAGSVLENADVIVADNFWIGGNMRLRFRKPVITPLAPWPGKQTPERATLVFEASRSPEPSASLREFLEEFFGRPVTLRVVHLSPNDSPHRTGMRVGVAVIE